MNILTRLSGEMSRLRAQMNSKLTPVDVTVSSTDPLVVVTADGTELEGAIPVGVPPVVGGRAVAMIGEGRIWLHPHVEDGDVRPGELTDEIAGRLASAELALDATADRLLDVEVNANELGAGIDEALAEAQAAVIEAAQALADAQEAHGQAMTGIADAAAAQAKADKAESDAAEAQAKADKAEADAAQAYEDALSWAKSRGANLVTNGSGMLGTNYNFPDTTFNSADAPTGASGSFIAGKGRRQFFSTEAIPVSPDSVYEISAMVRQLEGGPGAFYMLFAPLDRHGFNIVPDNYIERPGTRTTLAQDLKPGDTVLHMTSNGGGWSNAGEAYFRQIIFWDYVDPSGKAWEPGSYSRNYIRGAYPQYGISGTTMTLAVPYAGPLRPAGTPFGNGSAGSNYMYVGASLADAPDEWTYFSGRTEKGAHPRGGGSAVKKFPEATAATRVGFLTNYADAPYASRQAFANISVVDVTAGADALAEAEQARNLADTAKADAATADAKAVAARQQADTATGAAATAQAAATAAQSSADAAQANASSALSAAATAQGTADQAKADAASAAGIAGSKADVLIQNGEPAVSMRKATTLWIDTTGGANTPKRWNAALGVWGAVTDKAAIDAAAAASAAQGTADQAVSDAAAAYSAASAAAAAALGAQATADAANATASTASGRITVAAGDPTGSDGLGKPDGAIWEVHSAGTALRRFKWDAAYGQWFQTKLGQDFIGDNAIGQAQIAYGLIGRLEAGKAQITSADIGSLSVDKLRVIGGAEFPTAVIETLVGQDAFLQNLHVEGVITVGGPNKVGGTLIEHDSITSPHIAVGALDFKVAQGMKLSAGEIVGAKFKSPGPLPGDSLTIENQELVVTRDDEGEAVVTTSLGGADGDRLALGGSGYGSDDIGVFLDGQTGDGSFRGRVSVNDLSVGGQDLITELLEQFPRGILAMSNLTGDSPRAGMNSLMGLVMLSAPMRTNRVYKAHFSGMVACDTAGDVAQLYIRRFDPSSTDLSIGNIRPTSTYGEHFNIERVFPGPMNGAVRVGMLYKNSTANRGVFLSGRTGYPVQSYLEDMGPLIWNTDGAWAEFNDMGGTPISGTLPGNGARQYTTTYDAIWTRSWRGSGTVSDYLHHGYYGGYQRYSMVGFGGTMATDLNGATIQKAEVFLQNASWWGASGEALIGVTTHTSAPPAPVTTGSTTSSANWPQGAGRWVQVPWATNSRAITLGVGAGTGTNRYGKFANSGVKVRITYSK